MKQNKWIIAVLIIWTIILIFFSFRFDINVKVKTAENGNISTKTFCSFTRENKQ